MALISLNEVLCYPTSELIPTIQNTFTLDSADDYHYATAYLDPCVVTKVKIKTGTASVDVQMVVSLESFDTNGYPSGTIFNGGAASGSAIVTSGSWTEVNITNGTFTSATRVAIVVKIFDFQAGDTFQTWYSRISVGTIAANDVWNIYGGTRVNGGTPSKSNETLTYILHTSAASSKLFATPMGTISETSNIYDNDAGFDELGNAITIPFACRVVGIWFSMSNLRDVRLRFIYGSNTYLINFDNPSEVSTGGGVIQILGGHQC